MSLLPLPLQTFYWNTEKREYVIARIPSTSSITQSDEQPDIKKLNSWSLIIKYLKDEGINMRLVSRFFCHPSFTERYLQTPFGSVSRQINSFSLMDNLTSILEKSNPNQHYSNPKISFEHSMLPKTFYLIYSKFKLITTFRTLMFYYPEEVEAIQVQTWPCVHELALHFVKNCSIFYTFPNIKKLWISDPITKIHTNWDLIFSDLKADHLPHLKAIVFLCDKKFGTITTVGLDSLIQKAPNLRYIKVFGLSRQEIAPLICQYPHITFADPRAY